MNNTLVRDLGYLSCRTVLEVAPLLVHLAGNLLRSTYTGFVGTCHNVIIGSKVLLNASVVINNLGSTALRLSFTLKWLTMRVLNLVMKALARWTTPGTGYPITMICICIASFLARGRYRSYINAHPDTMKNNTLARSLAYFYKWMNEASVNTEHRHIRQQFRELPIQSRNKTGNHLHPVPRATRSSVVRGLKIFARLINKQEFYMQPRSSQTGPGQHYHFWSKDIDVPTKADPITNSSVVFYMDSDFYVDINAQLANNPVPTVIYTFDPVLASSPSTEYSSYTFVDDETIEAVSPHNSYKHKLWDYNVNTLRTFRFWSGFTHWEVEKRRISDTHSLVLLNPLAKQTGLKALFSYFTYGTENLHHVNVGSGKYAKIEVIGENEHYISISRKSELLSVRIDARDFYHMVELTRASKMGCTIPKIKTKTNLRDDESAILNSYLNDTITERFDRYKNFKVEWGIVSYQMFPSVMDMSPKPSLDAFMYPLYDGAYAPANTLANAQAAIEGRLKRLQTKKYTISLRHYTIMYALIDRLVPNKHILDFVDDEVVFDNQNRPTQQNILNEAIFNNSIKPFISMFVKKEAYGKISDPRIISTLKPADKLAWSKILYAMAMWIKNFDWYAFGRTPIEVNEKVASIARNATFINCTDFSRMDGRKTILTRTFNYQLMHALFRPSCHKEIKRLCAMDYNVHGCTPTYDDIMVVFFNTMMAWASGHPLTSIFNSLDNALINFTALVQNIGKGALNEEVFDAAYKRLNSDLILGGDDTVVADIPDDIIVPAAEFWGHVITSEIYSRGQQGVNFFARIYGPYVWQGDLNNHTDITRSLAKLHTCVNMTDQMTPIDKLSQKLTSLWFTDRNTPIIKEYIRKFLDLGGKLCERDNNQFQSYWAQYDESVQFMNVPDDWMLQDIGDFNYDFFIEELEQVQTLGDLLKLGPYNQAIIESKTQVVVDHDGDQDLVGGDDTRLEPREDLNDPMTEQHPNLDPPRLLSQVLAKKINGRRRHRRKIKDALDVFSTKYPQLQAWALAQPKSEQVWDFPKRRSSEA